ncbi:MAG: ADP-ribosylglycohydrolase family protein [Lentisphaerota bacterium]
MVWTGILLIFGAEYACADDQPAYRRLPVKEYRARMKAGWIGQMVGVALGASTELKYNNSIIPEEKMPQWKPEMISNAFGQDDLYVEMTFIRTMEQYGLDCSIRQAGIDFANTSYALWCANAAARTNLRRGIAPPDSSHPKFNNCPNAIDYQIEADHSGLIAPGMPGTVIALGEKFGRVVNYGEGVYGGQFIGAMYAEAFFEKDMEKIVRAGLRAIPPGSQYASMVGDILSWYKDVPEWENAWRICNEKYWQKPQYMRQSSGSVDARINGAFVVLALLYGNGDLDKTIIIATRCGKDSDCNPSSAGGIVFTRNGDSNIPDRFTKGLNEKTLFQYTAYNFPALIAVSEKLARQAILKGGGKIEKDASGDEIFLVPVKTVKPSMLESGWAPGPVANSKFTEAEMAQITAAIAPESVRKALQTFAPGWAITYCAPRSRNLVCGINSEVRGRKNVFVTFPFDNCTPCVLSRKISIPVGRKTVLQLTVAGQVNGQWPLSVQVDGRRIYRQFIGRNIGNDLDRKLITPKKAEELRKEFKEKAPGTDGWTELEIDLSPFAGREVLLEVCSEPGDLYLTDSAFWNCHDDTAFWAGINIKDAGDAGTPGVPGR